MAILYYMYWVLTFMIIKFIVRERRNILLILLVQTAFLCTNVLSRHLEKSAAFHLLEDKIQEKKKYCVETW